MNHFEINVSCAGRHVFATHPRSVTTEQECARLYNLFREAFPLRDGFHITVSKQVSAWSYIDPSMLPLSARDVVNAAWGDNRPVSAGAVIKQVL